MPRPQPIPYCWPLEPFRRAHPVRAYLNDPRISGKSRAFHFGIDISTPDGTPVYAVEPGTVYLEGTRSLAVLSSESGRAFGYWHVVPEVGEHQAVRQFQRLGTVEAPWGHLHFAERARKSYRNPLRAGALTPWVDSSSPRIVEITFSRAGKTVTAENVKGDVDVIVQAYDLPPLPVPPPWANMPVTPACLRWRVLGGGKVVRPWHTPVDFRARMLPQELFSVIFAPGTKQNHPNEPGTYRFFLAHGWTTSLLPNGPYRLEVEASDVSGNRARAGLPFTIAN